MKNDDRHPEKVINFKSTLKFFNSNLSRLNTKRLQLNRSKSIAKYFAKAHPQVMDLTPLDKTLGIMSFSLYMLRFSLNLCLLLQLLHDSSSKRPPKNELHNLYYSLFNDLFWSLINLTEYCWLTFRKSQTAGFQGLQLEVIAQLVDIVIMLIRFQQEKEAHLTQYRQSGEKEQIKLASEWKHKEIQFIRSLVTATAITLVLGLFAFSIGSIPTSPLIFSVVLISAIARILITIEKEKELKQQHLNDLNQIILYNIFTPVGVFLVLTTPTPLSILGMMGMISLHFLSSYLIDMKFSTPTPEIFQNARLNKEFSPSPDYAKNKL